MSTLGSRPAPATAASAAPAAVPIMDMPSSADGDAGGPCETVVIEGKGISPLSAGGVSVAT